jgi:4-aminobutyrate aminotransferase/(S)-3-amino-2-methylpropionate transaminase
VENAVKIARYQTQKPAIIAFENGFHGRTLLTMTLTSKVKPYKFGFGPYAPEVYRMPFAYCYRCPFKLTYPACDLACAEALNQFFITQVASEATAALIVEPVQGEGGFIAPPKEYFKRLKAICEAHQVLFIADEIQSGMGRTGTMFAMEHYDVVADLTTVAKSLAAGMPLSAVVGRKEIMDSVHPAGLGGTYGGNPLACSAALAVMEVFEQENLLEKAKVLGEKLQARLAAFEKEFELVGDIRGLGPMMAMELVTDRAKKTPAGDAAKTLVKYCFERGLILLTCGTYGNVIRLLMPLTIDDTQLDLGLEIIYDGLALLESKPRS